MYKYPKIRSCREERRLSQTEVANMLELKYQQYARYENGEVEMPLHFVIQLAKFYNVSIDYLVER